MKSYITHGLYGMYGMWLKSMVGYIMHVTTCHIVATNNHTPPGRVISAVSMEEFLHMQSFRVAKSHSDMNVPLLGILEKALDYVQGKRTGKRGIH